MARPSILLAAGAAAYVVNRLEGRRAIEAVREKLVETLSPPGDSTPEQRHEEAIVGLLLGRPEAAGRIVATPITDRIYGRLRDDDIAAVKARLEGDLAELYAVAEEKTRKRLTLNLAAAYGVLPALERAGLSERTPPDDVHAMARGPIAAGGDVFIADLVFDALDHAGFEVPGGATVLDFGASSGRVVRAIAAGRPDLECLACDPNEDAIAWAAANLSMARFFVSPQRPPIELDDASVQMAYAISIWSHFAERPAIEWLAELHRVIAPGGALVITTHGFDCLSTLLRREHVSAQTATAAAAAMMQGRHHFVDVFGAEGDWGVTDPGWGNAYLTLEWLLSCTQDDWAVRLNWPGALDQAQDVVVLERR
ncbi:MAG: class I SAM-dependent methyltransferase [Actinomycetota bacterium]|nr:class I SAM-dependent methyltransferase [Actinomycetota bacterium]